MLVFWHVFSHDSPAHKNVSHIKSGQNGLKRRNSVRRVTIFGRSHFNDLAFFSFDDPLIVGLLQSGHLFLWRSSEPQTLGLVYGLAQFKADGEMSSKTSKSRVVTPWNNVCNSGIDCKHSIETSKIENHFNFKKAFLVLLGYDEIGLNSYLTSRLYSFQYRDLSQEI